jgi:hypothetical protein
MKKNKRFVSELIGKLKPRYNNVVCTFVRPEIVISLFLIFKLINNQIINFLNNQQIRTNVLNKRVKIMDWINFESHERHNFNMANEYIRRKPKILFIHTRYAKF